MIMFLYDEKGNQLPFRVDMFLYDEKGNQLPFRVDIAGGDIRVRDALISDGREYKVAEFDVATQTIKPKEDPSIKRLREMVKTWKQQNFPREMDASDVVAIVSEWMLKDED